MEYIVFNRRNVGQLTPENPYFQRAIGICREWIAGREEFVLSTSGSTGPPKKIRVTASQMRASVRATSAALGIAEGTRALVCLNVEYVAGLMMLVRGMELDWELTVIEPSANPLLSVPENMDFDFTAVVPLQLLDVLVNKNTQSRYQKLGKILLGGGEITVRQAQLFKRLASPVYHGYGMTETVSHVALRRIDGTVSDDPVFTTAGSLTFGLDQRGCLFFNGAVTGFETIQTNDVAEIISETSFRLLGRADYIVNSGGIKIRLEKVEQEIEALFVKNDIECAFFAWSQPDERLGRKLILVVEGVPGEALKEKIAKILPNLSRYERPKHVYFTEKFIKTRSEKVNRQLTAALLPFTDS